MLRADMEEILVGKVRAEAGEAGILHLEAKPSPVETLFQTPRLMGYRSVHFCDEALLLQNLEVCSGT